MPAELAFLIVAVAVIAITYKTYVGYGDYRWYTKLGFFCFADWLECSFSGIYTAPCGFARKFHLFDQRAVFPVWLCLFSFYYQFYPRYVVDGY